ncbi:MAG TPA: hypothetical protein VJ785_01140 [Anaerolineales bacterium]|nr:hypothetical protein [Anaerolineales bacterium]
MIISLAARRKFAQSLLARRGTGETWEHIARSYPRGRDGSQIVKRGTICRIALSGGEYVPKDVNILRALGLIVAVPCDDEHTARTKRIIRGMVRRTNDAVVRKK